MKHGAFRYRKVGFEFPKSLYINQPILGSSRFHENIKILIRLTVVNELKTK